jgi:hypothetical protein
MATGTQLKKQLPHKINGFGDHFASAKLNPQPRFRQAQLPWFNLVALSLNRPPQSFGNFCGVIELHRASLSPGGLNPRSAAKTSVEQMNGRPLVNGWLSIAIRTSTMAAAQTNCFDRWTKPGLVVGSRSIPKPAQSYVRERRNA